MRRLAIYYAPPAEAPLTREAARWLGRDAFTGLTLEPSALNGFTRSEWQAIVADPQLYGFHATLKPPFRILEGVSDDQLRERLRCFAASRRQFDAPLILGALSRFLALVLAQPSAEFESLAADCVRAFDEFRAPPTAEELARRRRGRMNPAQLAYIDRWGYPYVMEEWRFHMTLTSSLGPETFSAAWSHLAQTFEPFCREPLRIDSICLFEQPEMDAPFRVLERFDFA